MRSTDHAARGGVHGGARARRVRLERRRRGRARARRAASRPPRRPGITATQVTVGGHFPLTGPAAPGYSEIPQAIDAYFKYVNANGGVHGRKLKMIARDDGYNPTNTVKVTKQLVLQDKIFAMLGGLGTPTHTKVVDFLNASRVPDLFVVLGLPVLGPAQGPPADVRLAAGLHGRGQDPRPVDRQKYKGKKVAYFLQNDDFGADGAKGLDKYIPKEPGRHAPDLRARQHRHRAADGQDQGVGRRGRRHVHDPGLHGARRAGRAQARLPPAARGQQRRLGPDDAEGAAEGVLEGQGPERAHRRHPERRLPAAAAATRPTTGSRCSRRSTTSTSPSCPFDGNVEYGMGLAYTFVEALQRAGREPDAPEHRRRRSRSQELTGPGLVPFRYSKDSHAGYTGAQIAEIKNGEATGDGQADGHRRRRRRDHRVHGERDGGAG